MSTVRSRVAIAVIVLLPYFGVGVLGVRVAGEPGRTDSKLQVDCAFYGDIARAPVQQNASELGRRIVRDAATSYQQRGCVALFGPLPPLPPEANQPAPTPTRTDD